MDTDVIEPISKNEYEVLTFNDGYVDTSSNVFEYQA